MSAAAAVGAVIGGAGADVAGVAGPLIAGLPDAPRLALAGAMTFVAALVRGLTGFGMAIILVPLIGAILPPVEAVAIGILLQAFVGPVGLPTILADADRPSALPMAGVAMATTPLGMIALDATPPAMARLLIALVAIAAFVAVVWPATHRAGPPGRAGLIGVGVASGFLTGFAAMPGPPVIPWYMRRPLSPATVRASLMLIFFGAAIAGTVAAALRGWVPLSTLVLACTLCPAVLVGNRLGGRAFGRIAPRVWRTVVALVLGLAAARAGWGLIAG